MKTYTVHSYDKDGNSVTTEHEMSAEMEAAFKRMQEWDGWCRCDKQETGEIVTRGHSCDVYCRNCGGVLQIG